jgi:partner of Y14 and mago protein
MPTTNTPAVSKAGITVSENGETYIPASTRADGSVRKEIRVRPGYRPPEDVEVYRNRTTEAWKNRGSGGVPGAEGLKSDANSAASTTANKNAKRRENRKKAAAATAQSGGGAGESAKAPSEQKGSIENVQAASEASAQPIDPEAEKEKEAKKLTKKLRQARELADKKEKGGVLLPEQFEKVIKITELIRQLDSLGFDANGEKKTEI